jgi:hypothetical protein
MTSFKVLLPLLLAAISVHGVAGASNASANAALSSLTCYNYTNSKLGWSGFGTPDDKGPPIDCPGTSCYRRHMQVRGELGVGKGGDEKPWRLQLYVN